MNVTGYDKEGRPLVFDRFAQLDLPGLLRKYGKEEIIKVWIYRTEYMNKIFAEASEKFGKKIFQITLFMDLKGVGAAQGNKVGLDLYQELMAISQDNYPDRLYRAYIINIPPGFSFMWRIVSWFFDEGLKKKFVFVDGDATSGVVMEACKDLVDASNVPKAIGGTWTIGDDDYCTAIIKPGGRVVVDTSLMKPLSISAGSTVAVPIVITRPQSTLSYHFLSEENDIGFSCSHHESTDPAVAAASSNKKILKPMEIVNAHRENQRGTLICDQVGTYTLVFSNSHAWLFSKTVRYEVSVVEPPSDEDLKAREERF